MLLVVDTETTGLTPGVHAPIEIAAIGLSHDLEILFEFEQPIEPYGVPWEPIAWKMNAARALDRDCVEPDRAYLNLRDLIKRVSGGGDVYQIGANPTFDRRMIAEDPRSSIRRAPITSEWHYRTGDIEASILVPWLRGETEGIGLRHARKLIGLPGEQAHTAIQDCRDIVAVLLALVKR